MLKVRNDKPGKIKLAKSIILSLAVMKKTTQNKKVALIILILVFLVGIMSLLLYQSWQHKFTAPRNEAPTVQFRISKDNTLTAIVGNLHYYGFIRDENAFRYVLEHANDTNPGREGAIKIGGNTVDTQAMYEISQTMNAWQLADALLNKGTFSDCNHGCPPGAFYPEIMPGGDLAPTVEDKYKWVKSYEDCVKAIGHDGGQLSSEQYYERTGIRMCVSPDGREFTEGKEGWKNAVGG
jgi:cell division protein YceG involved in septum cleavage